jgi:uncharacterized protein (TIGR02266 family)
MSVQNQRAFPRITTAIEVAYKCEAGSFTDHTRDLSAKGLYIVTGRPLDVGSPITVSFNLPGFDHDFCISGRVVRNCLSEEPGRPAGMGIEFLDIGKDDEKVILQFVVQSQLTQKGY